MRLTRTKRDHGVKFNITPMIDIVFLLIIFFMTVSQITRVIDQPMPLPSVPAGAVTESPSSVTVNVDQRGKIVVAGKQFSLNKISQVLRAKLDKLKSDHSRLKIELRCDKRCESEHVNRVIEELSSLGFASIRISVSREIQEN